MIPDDQLFRHTRNFFTIPSKTSADLTKQILSLGRIPLGDKYPTESTIAHLISDLLATKLLVKILAGNSDSIATG